MFNVISSGEPIFWGNTFLLICIPRIGVLFHKSIGNNWYFRYLLIFVVKVA